MGKNRLFFCYVIIPGVCISTCIVLLFYAFTPWLGFNKNKTINYDQASVLINLKETPPTAKELGDFLLNVPKAKVRVITSGKELANIYAVEVKTQKLKSGKSVTVFYLKCDADYVQTEEFIK